MIGRLPRLSRSVWAAVSGGAVGVIGGCLAWVVFGSSLLAVSAIEVTGQQRVGRSTIVAAAAVSMGEPLARVDNAAVAARVAGLRVVESAEVQRVWPSTLRIRVRERVPVAAVPSGSKYLLLDREGVRVGTVAQPPEDLPVVRVQAAGRSAHPSPGGYRGQREPSHEAGGRRVNRAALSVLSSLPDGLASKVASVVVDRDQRVTLRMRTGATVIWGTLARADEKARILRSLLQRVNARTYNVSSPDVVTTK